MLISGTVVSIGSVGFVIGSQTISLPSVFSINVESTQPGEVPSASDLPGGKQATGPPTAAHTGGDVDVTAFDAESGASKGRGFNESILCD